MILKHIQRYTDTAAVEKSFLFLVIMHDEEMNRVVRLLMKKQMSVALVLRFNYVEELIVELVALILNYLRI